jgi:TRAP-type C4-dicarboxylate transport system substrate-binding protein
MSFKHAFAATVAVAAVSSAAPLAAQQPVTIKIGHPTIRSGMDHWAQTFKAGIEKRLPGRVKVDIFPGGQLGTQPATISGVQLGTIEMAQMPPESLTGVDPRFDAFSAPGLFDDIEHAHRALHDAQFRKSTWNILDSKNMLLVGMACEAPSEYATVEPVRNIAEFKG